VTHVFRSSAALVFALWAGAASAGWSVSLDAESFKWREDLSPQPPVTEKGPRWGLGWEYEQLRPAGWQFAYRGQFRHGTVDYTGWYLFDPSTPATARTQYTGLVNELQGIYRFGASPLGFELVGGLALDYWRRNILPDQKEDYSVLFLRLGFNLDPRAASGWFTGAGFKFPFYAAENGHLQDLGFDQNPTLEPKGRPSLYAQLGYRFTPQWSLIGYYDSYRFAESNPVFLTSSDPGVCAPFAPPCDAKVVQPASKVDTLGLRLRYSFQ